MTTRITTDQPQIPSILTQTNPFEKQLKELNEKQIEQIADETIETIMNTMGIDSEANRAIFKQSKNDYVLSDVKTALKSNITSFLITGLWFEILNVATSGGSDLSKIGKHRFTEEFLIYLKFDELRTIKTSQLTFMLREKWRAQDFHLKSFSL